MLPILISTFLILPVAIAMEFCDAFDYTVAGDYIIYNNMWNYALAANWSYQCTGLNSYTSDSMVGWETSWFWQGNTTTDYSYPSASYNFTARELRSIKYIPTGWFWSYQCADQYTAVVGYDMLLSSTATGSATYEVIIWLDSSGVPPISQTGLPIASPNITSPNITTPLVWDLYLGYNNATTVYTFVPPSAQSNFSSELKTFYQYLEQNESLSPQLYLQTIDAGTAPFNGSGCTFTTNNYFVNIQ